MRRREFLKNVFVASSSFLCDRGQALASSMNWRSQSAIEPSTIPNLDELAGDWVSGKDIEQTPALSNFHGSLETSRNILGVQNFTLPPLAQGAELAILSLDNVKLDAQVFRWYPYQVLRKARSNGIEVVSTVRMPFENSGILFSVELTNLEPEVRTTNLTIGFRTAIRQYIERWAWETPRPEEKSAAEFSTSVVYSKDSQIFLTQDRKSRSEVAVVFLQPPDEILDKTGCAAWSLRLRQGESFRLTAVMAAGEDVNSVIEQVSEWSKNFAATWEQVEECWQQRFRAAFTPDNGHFSGNLPTLVTPDTKMSKLYYTSIVSLLCLERTNLNPHFSRVFVTCSPRWATTLVYFWDASFYATMWALLDPLAMRQQLKLFLDSDIHSCYAIDFQTLQPVGPWYSANDYSIFRLVTTYVYVTGDWKFLEESLREDQRVLEVLEGISLHGQSLAKPPSLLADYGSAANLLETVPTYEGYVPSMNAANVWMLRSMAKLRRRRGEVDRAVQLKQQADQLANEVLRLYVEGKGFWACRRNNGENVEVRHCIDFFTLIDSMQSDLGQRRIDEMVQFVNQELWTPHWLRALSLRDAAAKVATRADHGSTGSYDAWPALTAEAMFRVGRKEEALARLHSLEQATREGPFGQAHYVAIQQYPVRKAQDYQDYFESASGAFAEMILRTIFGFAPDADNEWELSPPKVPGFEGQLINLRYGGKLVTMSSQS